ncbi:hypothetical protein EDD22DRAFT_890249 [Suillus occidentalis]|nr:hypothetical protein EDD22DRAFT_890249 [Suillus occidentalis]
MPRATESCDTPASRYSSFSIARVVPSAPSRFNSPVQLNYISYTRRKLATNKQRAGVTHLPINQPSSFGRPNRDDWGTRFFPPLFSRDLNVLMSSVACQRQKEAMRCTHSGIGKWKAWFTILIMTPWSMLMMHTRLLNLKGARPLDFNNGSHEHCNFVSRTRLP